MKEGGRLLGACVLIRSQCDIFLAREDPEIAQRVVKLFKEDSDNEVAVDDVCCSGCRGLRPDHWSPGCEIPGCCVDEREHELCSRCPEFPRDYLESRADSVARPGEALTGLTKSRKMDDRY